MTPATPLSTAFDRGEAPLVDERELVEGVLSRMATDLSMIIDREFQVEDITVERRTQRPVGTGSVHISFKFGIELGGSSWQGCLLVPLPEAVTMAGFMMMLTDEAVERERARTELDGPFKGALLEVGKFLAGACDGVLRRVLSEECSTRSEGCQGVRADIRPAMDYVEGTPLLVGRARACLHEFEPFELILVLPDPGRIAREEVLSV